MFNARKIVIKALACPKRSVDLPIPNAFYGFACVQHDNTSLNTGAITIIVIFTTEKMAEEQGQSLKGAFILINYAISYIYFS
ncbi:MAG: hypothetical protein VW456_11375 [Alphaproteobacteria bacterium]